MNPELGIVSTKRYTVGPRVQGITLFNIVYEIEAPYQFGRLGGTTSGSKDIRAYAFHVDLSRSFEGPKFKPNFTLEYNYASGDNDPNDNISNTFNPLYQSTHDPYGLMDFFRWQNMRELALNTTLTLTKKLKITPQVNFLWLASKYDSWYNSSGTALRTKTTGDRNYHVGDEVSLRIYYELNKNLKLEAGYAHFFTGRYIKDTGANDDADWCYSQLSFKY